MLIIKFLFVLWLMGWGAFDAIVAFMALAIAATHDFVAHPVLGTDWAYGSKAKVIGWTGLRGSLGLASFIVGNVMLIELLTA